MGSAAEKFRPLLAECSDVFRLCARKTKILTSLSWSSTVAFEFFKKKEQELPKPKYEIDPQALTEIEEAHHSLKPKLQGSNPVAAFLRRINDSFLMAARLLQNIETPAFFQISTELYGSGSSQIFHGQTSNVKLAEAISNRLADVSVNDIAESRVMRSAEELAFDLQKRIKESQPSYPLKVEVTSDIVAKVVAGVSRLRIRSDARFSSMDLEALWKHEVESHALTALNGSCQPLCSFLAAGGPRTTKTQEGIAVFHEIFGHTMSQGRFIALCNRVLGVHKVEEGADFMELYRWFKEKTESPMEAFYSAQRIFRGAMVSGKYPFTKDVVYLSGLFEIFNFLRLAAKSQNRMLLESLVSGRIALEDVGTVAWLRTHGLVDPPHYVPHWLSEWESLLSFFSFSAVLEMVDIAAFQSYFDDQAHMQHWDFSL